MTNFPAWFASSDASDIRLTCSQPDPKAKAMKNAWFALVVFCAFSAAQGCGAPSPDWNGTWKLNPSKSSYQGQVLTISISPDDEYRFFETSGRTIRCDGKDRPTENNRTLASTKAGTTILDIILKENGIKTRATHDELSADGKVFTTTVTDFQANEPVFTTQIIYSRLSGSNGFAGQWRETGYLQEHADMTVRLDNRALHIDYPRAGQQIDAPLDGIDAAVHGPHASEGTTYSVRFAGRREFLILTKSNGKVLTQGSLELSDDGKTVTEYRWSPDRPAAKVTLVYERK